MTEPSGTDARSPDRRTHNELSGTAQTAAMARTVYGGIHVHHSRRWKPPKARPSVRLVVGGMVVVVTVASIVVIQTVVRPRDNDQVGSRPGSDPPVVATAIPPATMFDPGRQDPDTSLPIDLDIPPRLNAASFVQRIEDSEHATLIALQAYRCRNMLRPRAAVVYLEVNKSSDLRSVARDYAERYVLWYWGHDSMARFSRGLVAERSAIGSGRIYRGLEVGVDVRSMTWDPCVGSEGHLKALILDGGEMYLVLLVMADLSGDPRQAEVPTMQDLDHLLDEARPRL